MHDALIIAAFVLMLLIAPLIGFREDDSGGGYEVLKKSRPATAFSRFWHRG